MATKHSGSVAFPVDGAARQFRYSVSATHGKLIVWLEDCTTRQQWQTQELAVGDFTTSETALPQASVEDYAMQVVECLTPDPVDANTMKSLSGLLGDGCRVLRIGFALQASKFSTPLEYAFMLAAVKVSAVDVINARLKDVEDAAKTAVDEVAKLRFENEKLEDRLDKTKYKYRLVKEEMALFKQQQHAENTKIREELANLHWANKTLEVAVDQLKAGNQALREESGDGVRKRKRVDV